MAEIGNHERPLRVAVIGAGPAGFYAAQALLKQKLVAKQIDIFDRLPAPFGLVRYGVAPDHPKIKNVRKIYNKVMADERVRFYGNVNFGTDLTHADVKAYYDQVIYTVGAQSDRRLGIDGEDFVGSYSATEFVAWYNSHPDYKTRSFDLSHSTAVVIGMGNVAMDVARVLAKTRAELQITDMADHALDALEQSNVKDIYVIARRGPVQSKFTPPEIKEFGELDVAEPVVESHYMDLDAASAAALEGDKMAQKNMKVLEKFAALESEGKERRVHFVYCKSPVAILGEDGKVTGIKLVHNELVPTDSGYINSKSTDTFETIDCGLVLRSVGYRGIPLPGVPFHERWHTIPNDKGRVTDNDGNVVPGEYCAGWIKRGPSGIIGTNKADAVESVNCMIEDARGLTPVDDDKATPEAVKALLDSRSVRYVSFEGWEKINAAEVAKGEAQGRPRVKFDVVEDFLSVAGG